MRKKAGSARCDEEDGDSVSLCLKPRKEAIERPAETETLRLFFAVKMPPAVRYTLAQIQNTLRETQADVKWVEIDNLHLTIRFLGSVERARLFGLQEAGRRTATTLSPFQLAIGGLGAFPEISRPRVLWIGVLRGTQEMTSLYRKLEDELRTIGFPQEERPYAPHMTLGRVRSPKNLSSLEKEVRKFRTYQAGEMEVQSFCLIRSRLMPSGPEYSVIEEFPLVGRGET